MKLALVLTLALTLVLAAPASAYWQCTRHAHISKPSKKHIKRHHCKQRVSGKPKGPNGNLPKKKPDLPITIVLPVL